MWIRILVIFLFQTIYSLRIMLYVGLRICVMLSSRCRRERIMFVWTSLEFLAPHKKCRWFWRDDSFLLGPPSLASDESDRKVRKVGFSDGLCWWVGVTFFQRGWTLPTKSWQLLDTENKHVLLFHCSTVFNCLSSPAFSSHVTFKDRSWFGASNDVKSQPLRLEFSLVLVTWSSSRECQHPF